MYLVVMLVYFFGWLILFFMFLCGNRFGLNIVWWILYRKLICFVQQLLRLMLQISGWLLVVSCSILLIFFSKCCILCLGCCVLQLINCMFGLINCSCIIFLWLLGLFELKLCKQIIIVFLLDNNVLQSVMWILFFVSVYEVVLVGYLLFFNGLNFLIFDGKRNFYDIIL